MKQELKILFFLFLCGFFTVVIQAQQTNPASGGNATGAGGSVSYTTGQITYAALSGTNGSLIQGVQQPYEISVITAIEELSGISLNCSVYPNPTTDYVVLKIGNYDKTGLVYQLTDNKGNILENKRIDTDELIISMRNNPSSIYFLKITDQKRTLKTFKIIKN
jgi:hypothetical protein